MIFENDEKVFEALGIMLKVIIEKEDALEEVDAYEDYEEEILKKDLMDNNDLEAYDDDPYEEIKPEIKVIYTKKTDSSQSK